MADGAGCGKTSGKMAGAGGSFARPAGPPGSVLVVVAGGVASGKTTLSRAMAGLIGAEHVEADEVRRDLLGRPDPGAPHPTRWGAGLSPVLEGAVYAEVQRRAERALERGCPVVVDGCFARASSRERLRGSARRHGARFLFITCHAPVAVLRQRLADRDRSLEGELWQTLHDAVVARWEPEDALAPAECRALDTGGDLSAALERIEAWLRVGRSRREIPQPLGAVTFDCWNTLLVEEDWQTAHARRVEALRRAAAEAGRAVGTEEAARAFDAAWERHMRVWHEGAVAGAREVARWGLAELGLREPHPALEHLVRAFEQASHSSRVEALEGAAETLALLAGRGVPLALVCDTGLTPGSVVRRHLRRLGLGDAMRVQVFSDEEGYPKPDPRMFEAALRPLGVAPERAVHVGDLRRTDVAGAREIGMAAVRIRCLHDDRGPLPEADFVVDDHRALRALLAPSERDPAGPPPEGDRVDSARGGVAG